ncbi:hypothetical protein F5B17DRAFT_423969 [Nemania serpens]|nr:hypothetical protein F5B17DRAFT_423969 [Nemania serpens]
MLICFAACFHASIGLGLSTWATRGWLPIPPSTSMSEPQLGHHHHLQEQSTVSTLMLLLPIMSTQHKPTIRKNKQTNKPWLLIT